MKQPYTGLRKLKLDQNDTPGSEHESGEKESAKEEAVEETGRDGGVRRRQNVPR